MVTMLPMFDVFPLPGKHAVCVCLETRDGQSQKPLPPDLLDDGGDGFFTHDHQPHLGACIALHAGGWAFPHHADSTGAGLDLSVSE